MIDVENIVDKVKEIYENNMNAELTVIDTEKADGITIPSIPANGYYISLYDQLPNKDPFMVFDVDISSTDSVNCETGKNIEVTVMVIKEDVNNDDRMWRIMMRYQRALLEIAEANFDIGKLLNRSEVTSVPIVGLFDGQIRRQASAIIITGVLA